MTVLEYLVIAIVIGAVVFGVAVVVFGRGEQMAALPARTSPSELPANGIRGNHVREVRFGLALRGYRMSDVDWTLERLADEIDLLRSQLPPESAGQPDGGATIPELSDGRTSQGERDGGQVAAGPATRPSGPDGTVAGAASAAAATALITEDPDPAPDHTPVAEGSDGEIGNAE